MTILNITLLVLGGILLVSTKSTVTGAVVGAFGLDSSRAVFFGLLFVCLSLVLFTLRIE